MTESVRYRQLCAQIKSLRRHFLPCRFSPTGSYKKIDRISVRSLGFRILSVAEIESYLEDRCVQIAKTALDSWLNNELYSIPLQCITVFSDVKYERMPSYLVQKPKDQKDWDDLVSPRQRIIKAVEKYLAFVQKENHGIRESNLMALLIPIGLDLRLLDSTFIDRIDFLGSIRGDAAHTSCSMALKIGVDPEVEFTEVRKVLEGLIVVDHSLNGILAKTTI